MLFSSIKFKIFFLVALIAAPIVLFVGLYTKRDVEEAMLADEDRSQKNVLNLLMLNISGSYKYLLGQKVDAVLERRERLEKLNGLILSVFDRFHRAAMDGRLTEAEAKLQALIWVCELPQSEKEYVFVYDSHNRALAYPDPLMIGTDVSGFRDLKDRPAAQAARDDIAQYGSAMLTYRWKPLSGPAPVRKYGQFSLFAPWNWIVAAAGDIEDIEREVRNRQDELLAGLRANLPQVKIASTGFAFIFSGAGRILAPPPGHARNLALLTDPASGRSFMDHLKDLAQHGEGRSMRFVGVDGLERQAYAAWFKALDWYVAVVASVDEIREPGRVLVERLVTMIVAVFAAGMVLALSLAARMAQPLVKLADHAKALPSTDFTAPPLSGAVLDEVERSHDEVGRLAQSFHFMETTLRRNIHDLMSVTAAKERIQGELNVAKSIQLGLLQKEFPAFPKRREIDLYAKLESAKEVGGDLYDFFFTGKDRLFFCIGDVSDKGVPAALFMAVAITLIRAGAKDALPLYEVMNGVNAALARGNPNTMFVTLLMVSIDVKSGEFVFVNAGHNPPLLVTAAGEAEFVDGVSGPPAGAFEEAQYRAYSGRIEPGGALFLYTDGVTEAMNAERALFGNEPLAEAVRAFAAENAAGLVDSVMTAVRRHADGAPQSDDITMLCLRRSSPFVVE